MTHSMLGRTTLVAAFLAAAMTQAGAADLPSRYAPAEPYYNPAPTFTWSGFYAGVNGQLGSGSFSKGGDALFGSSPFGGFGGITAGYNYQSGQLLVGVEADAAFGSVQGNGNFGFGTNSYGTLNGVGTLRARVGYVYNQALFYVTGGYAGTSLNGKLADYGGSPNLVLNESHYLNGYAVGLGVEYALTTRWSIKGEYVFDGFGSQQYFSGTRDTISSGVNLSTVRLGLNYHFF